MSGRRATVARAAALRGTLRLPADKSIAHRALIFDALAAGRGDRHPPRPGADVRSTLGAMERLGAVTDVRDDGGGGVRVALDGGGALDRRTPAGRRRRGARLRQLGDHHAPAVGGPRRPARQRDPGRGRVALAAAHGAGRRPTARDGRGRRDDGRARAGPDPGSSARWSRSSTSCRSRAPRCSGRSPSRRSPPTGRTGIAVPGPTRDHTERLLGWLGAPVTREGLETLVDGPAGFAARDIDRPRRHLFRGGLARGGRDPSRRGPSVSRASGSTRRGSPSSRSCARWEPTSRSRPLRPTTACRSRSATLEVRGGGRLRADPHRRRAGGRPHRRAADARRRDGRRRRHAASCAMPGSCASRNRTGSRSSSRACGPSASTPRSCDDGWRRAARDAARRLDRDARATTASPWPSRSRR